MLLTNDKRIMISGSALLALVLVSWFYALNFTPSDAQQGDVYRIIYVHVPVALTALGVCGLGLLITSFIGLRRQDEVALLSQRAWVEVGLLTTGLTLITGAVWGKPTWGTYWTWEPRLTTTLLLAILFTVYLFVFDSLARGPTRVRLCSILGIVIFTDIPIIYQSVKWFRTLHQPASLLSERGSTYDSEILETLIFCMLVVATFSVVLWRVRRGNLLLKDELEQRSMTGNIV